MLTCTPDRKDDTMKIDYRNTLFGDEIRNVVFLDEDGAELYIAESPFSGGSLVISCDGGWGEIIRRQEAVALIPVIQHWLEHGRLPEEKEGADK